MQTRSLPEQTPLPRRIRRTPQAEPTRNQSSNTSSLFLRRLTFFLLSSTSFLLARAIYLRARSPSFLPSSICSPPALRSCSCLSIHLCAVFAVCHGIYGLRCFSRSPRWGSSKKVGVCEWIERKTT
jgi:hypothetical protein